ncbi:DoxX family protein [Mucisphaera sp.]|uniref:DoxX family protein n=1 Tax=Mucisphaera sp. TaxID=2913024 RepID=UPI003D12E0D0
MSKSTTGVEFTLMLNRAAVGLYFLLAGWFKVMGEINNGVGHFFETSFKGLQPAWLPDFFGYPYAIALPWAEVVIGATLTLGLFTRISAALTWLMLLSFTIALVVASGSLSAGTPGPWHPNFFLILITTIFVLTGGGRYSLDATFLGKAAHRAASTKS